MAILSLYIYKNDLQPYFLARAVDSNGDGIDLSGADIVCTMRLKGASTAKIDRQGAGITIDPDQTTNKGWFHYAWQGPDTNTTGVYKIEFEVTPPSGGKFTIPGAGQGVAQVIISNSLDAT